LGLRKACGVAPAPPGNDLKPGKLLPQRSPGQTDGHEADFPRYCHRVPAAHARDGLKASSAALRFTQTALWRRLASVRLGTALPDDPRGTNLRRTASVQQYS
jgi:hypothetical protein